ncbi:UNVERIFIED_CONTAM: hypothetical protein Sradi_5644400 [Sesamum radiatum]|uniref:Uncharacterized protein n=1 Tax=Sesamum radiatum TaxID=300843 RepID=A0AAW2KZF2_SESRA
MLEGFWQSRLAHCKKSPEFQSLLADRALKYYFHEFQICAQQFSTAVYLPDGAWISFLDTRANLATALDLYDERSYEAPEVPLVEDDPSMDFVGQLVEDATTLRSQPPAAIGEENMPPRVGKSHYLKCRCIFCYLSILK